MGAKRSTATVQIELGYSALINLRRFYMRGVRCAKEGHDGYRLYPCESHKVLLEQFEKAAKEMKLIKAKATLHDKGG